MARFRNRATGVVVSRSDGKVDLPAAKYERLDAEAATQESDEAPKKGSRKRPANKSN